MYEDNFDLMFKEMSKWDMSTSYSKIEDDAKKARTQGGKLPSKKDLELPQEDSDIAKLGPIPEHFKIQCDQYHKAMKERLLVPKGKFVDFKITGIEIARSCCENQKKVKNTAGGTKFWQCKNCKADLGDVNES